MKEKKKKKKKLWKKRWKRFKRGQQSSPWTPLSWLSWLGMGLFWLLIQLPTRWLQRLGRGLGLVLYTLLPGRRQIARTNLQLCFPELTDREREHLVRENFASSAMAIFEALLGWWGSDRRIAALYTVEGEENLAAARADGSGVILLGGHYTTLEISGRLFGPHVQGIYPIYKPAKNPVVERLMVQARKRYFDDLLPNTDLRGVVRQLRRGNATWYAPDQDFGRRDTVFAPFMGVPAASLVATARLAKLGRAKVLPFYSQRLPDGRYLVRIEPALENFPSGDDVADATTVNQVIEKQVRRAPEQYLWIHQRFKTRPPGEPDLYR
ncbi:LpxL/LpxP family Kdo(2)-lipid IV(A) lauroyl/palmitoleoyl acyltransferase [Desulfurivibrio alkaliphilus]|uniref:Lipid A biosynthesis lauroyl (Or palmitoleoyl) acyltransferase n=1 Tax=Desulfurivibrio alkaliphilus (strain DSM 19089 / UNIQEM U267 / AHT2) TaxID=589865 RepID=D6Z0R7_DESAT|nr:LpxL/LpxP family Kdo(2)-lipid IV(A) lauroyl/palmitoleoyl acyltransferase [Desulfurivibrio alkaliphilus]ADH85296.1 lipid A biosynthesis lauroyl (or palmitoleoyl) acyltransferase [Desulfurivibrio alkaliphilus AHT 2]